jgi:hypothetical protein
MSVLTDRWKFKQSMIADAPEHGGVYALWHDDALLHLGHANGAGDTIRSRLAAHLERAEARGDGFATHYSWEIATNPKQCEAEILRALESRQPQRKSGSHVAQVRMAES